MESPLIKQGYQPTNPPNSDFREFTFSEIEEIEKSVFILSEENEKPSKGKKKQDEAMFTTPKKNRPRLMTGDGYYLEKHIEQNTIFVESNIEFMNNNSLDSPLSLKRAKSLNTVGVRDMT